MDLSVLNTQIPKIRVSLRVIAGIIAAIGIAFFWWVSNTKVPELDSKTNSYISQNKSLEETEKNLSALYAEMDFYLDETERLYKETEEVLKEFPTFMYLEDKILYADTLLKGDLNGYNLAQFTYGQSNYVMNVSYGVDQSQLELYSVALTGRFVDLTYTQIKDLLNYGLNAPQRFVMNTITMGYNEESGYISGDFSFMTYFIPGQTEPYEFPESVIQGLGNSNRIDDLFGARKTPVSINQGEE